MAYTATDLCLNTDVHVHRKVDITVACHSLPIIKVANSDC